MTKLTAIRIAVVCINQLEFLDFTKRKKLTRFNKFYWTNDRYEFYTPVYRKEHCFGCVFESYVVLQNALDSELRKEVKLRIK